MCIAIREDDDISGVELEGCPIRRFDHGAALDHQVVNQEMRGSRSEPVCHIFRGGRRESPGSGEFSIEEHGSVQLDPAQDFGECVHLSTWTFCKLIWNPSKGV